MIKYEGWVMGMEKDRQLLEKLGITITSSIREINNKAEFDVCDVTEEKLRSLDKYWGRLIWGLTPQLEKEEPS